MKKMLNMLLAVGVLSVVMGCGADNGDDGDMDNDTENQEMNDDNDGDD